MKGKITVIFENSNDYNLRFYIEPWGEEGVLPPNAFLKVVFVSMLEDPKWECNSLDLRISNDGENGNNNENEKFLIVEMHDGLDLDSIWINGKLIYH